MSVWVRVVVLSCACWFVVIGVCLCAREDFCVSVFGCLIVRSVACFRVAWLWGMSVMFRGSFLCV